MEPLKWQSAVSIRGNFLVWHGQVSNLGTLAPEADALPLELSGTGTHLQGDKK